MSKEQLEVLRVGLQGMDERTQLIMKMFVERQYKDSSQGRVMIVDNSGADLTILDLDGPTAKQLLQVQREQHPNRPLIVSSVNPMDDIEATKSLKKPLQSTVLIQLFNEIRVNFKQNTAKSQSSSQPKEQNSAVVFQRDVVSKKQLQKTAHKSAMLMDERSFSSFVGFVDDIDPNEKNQLKKAHFDPGDYLLGFVQSAYRTAEQKKIPLKLNTTWKPLYIFPETREIWIDADDKQLRFFCSVPLKSFFNVDTQADNTGPTITLSSFDAADKQINFTPELMQPMDAFLWKLALWTAKCRVPNNVDILKPVYLKHWPNMTRFLISPHALRIAAFMIRGPRTLIDIAKVMNIRQQYVFAFFTAAHAIGIAEQAARQADNVVEPSLLNKSAKAGVLKKILSHLRFR